ncbi:MAG: SpoIID/LytB domain-containing protein [Patescibacteria group bacterium]
MAAAPGLTPAVAAAPKYAAKEMIRSERRLILAPGESRNFTIGFKNLGSSAWLADGNNFVSIYTYGPKYRNSVFADAGWLGKTQPAKLTETKVGPGAMGRISFTLYAPLETGIYKETFALAVEGLAWIPGGEFMIEIEVKKPAPKTVGSVSGVLSDSPAAGYKALQMLVSDRRLSLEGGTTKEFRVGFKNVGRVPWSAGGAAPLALKAAAGNAFSFRDPSWTDTYTATPLSVSMIKPGELTFFNFKLSAPRAKGVYLARFTLAAGNEPIEGGEIEIPIEVREGTVASSVKTLSDPGVPVSGSRGPDIRVGLINPDDPTRPVTLTANGSYRLMDSSGSAVATLSGPTSVVFDPASRTYAVSNGSLRQVLSKYIYFEPVDPATIFEILSYENRPTWDTSINFNKFRGKIEIFYVQTTGNLWVVEVVPLEDYMRGFAETSNGSHLEYQKALVTAARTYALFVVSIGGKHQSEFFDLNTTGNDQVYKGYASELIRPNVVRAVEETRGMTVTYNNELVVTPYFSRSDGRTRAWTEVWSSTDHPWLVSKPAPYDQGKELWGHGVGMSASDALGRAEAGTGWMDILKYYYTGIELRQAY